MKENDVFPTKSGGPPGYYQRYRSCRRQDINDKRHGKYLKHIFNALKNKTSSELVTFINVNSVPNEIEYEISNNALVSDLSGGAVIPQQCFRTYPAYARRAFECDETATGTWKSSRSSRPTRDSDITMASFRVIIGNETTQAKIATNTNSEEQIAEASEEDIVHGEFYEYKPTENFFDKVLSLFKGDNNKSGGDELKLEPIFRNSNCKCSDTVIKLSESKPKRRISCKCSATVVKLDKYKCDQCGKIDLEKIDESKSTNDEEALLALLKVEANRNCDQIGNIQAQLNEQTKRIEDLNRKFTSLLELVTSERLTQGDLADESTETVPARNQQVETQLKLSDSCTCHLMKKPSFFARIFKKSKCNTSCKCCIVPAHDKKQCHYYSDKKKKKKEEKTVVVTCPNLIPPEKTISQPQKSLTDKSNTDKNRPYREVYEEKSDKTGFLDRVYSMFRGKMDSCACTEASQDPKRCSETSGKPKCNSLNRYKCKRCGKLDLEKLDKRCPKLRLEEDALMFLLKLEAKQNFKQIKSIQGQLQCHLEMLNDMNQKYVNIVKIIAPEKLDKADTYISTDTVATRDQQSQKTSISCLCATKKKPSFICKLFKKSKCDTSCKCCVRMMPDKSKCQHFTKKEKPKKTKTEKEKKHKDKKKVQPKECECP